MSENPIKNAVHFAVPPPLQQGKTGISLMALVAKHLRQKQTAHRPYKAINVIRRTCSNCSALLTGSSDSVLSREEPP